MARTQITEAYRRLREELSPDDLDALADLLASAREKPRRARHSIAELRGLGAEIWRGVDAQQYVDELRNEWDQRP